MGEGSRVAALFKVEQQRVIAVHHTDQVITAVVIVFDAALFCTHSVRIVPHREGGSVNRNRIKPSTILPCEGHTIPIT